MRPFSLAMILQNPINISDYLGFAIGQIPKIAIVKYHTKRLLGYRANGSTGARS